jgi:hypothetical protein
VRVRPPGDAADAGASDGGVDECASDGDCTAGSNGRCSVRKHLTGPTVRKCSYDACTQDADCGSNGVCGCGLGFAGQNVCLTRSNCRTDADCAGGERCAPSVPFLLWPQYSGIETGAEVVPKHPTSTFDEALGYFCTTAKDTCCGNAVAMCTYDEAAQHWAWGYAP